MTPARTVTVAVITYRRPVALDGLLAALADEVSGVPGPAEILVVDNDPDRSARAVADRHPAVTYRAEPEPGIAAARNRAIAETAGRDVLVFVDDDEVPEPGWLRALLEAADRSGAEAVTGAVVSRFDVEPDEWVRAGGFFARRHRAGIASGELLSTAASNNLLLDRAALDRLDLRFDVDFGLSGGSDTLFSRALVARGGRIVWCPEAVVVEQVPVERLSRRWLLTRAVSYGTTDVRVALRLADGPAARLRARLRCLRDGLPRVGAGAARYVVGRLLRSPRHQALGLQTLLRGCGLVGGVFGYSYERYRRAPG